jgi:four helix bundle protein
VGGSWWAVGGGQDLEKTTKQGGFMTVKSYRDLETWQQAMALVLEVYRVTKLFPKEELFGLTSQVRRAVVSIPSNIAEGQGRTSTKEFLQHLSIAYGSLCETETQILIAKDLNYLAQQDYESLSTLTARVGRLINGLSKSLQR